MDVASLVNSILADDGYNALSEDTKNKFEQYLRTPAAVQNEVGTNTTSESGNNQTIDFDVLNNSTSIREAKFLEMQREIEVVNDQFKNALKQKHELMLHNETLLTNLHEAEVRERRTKMDEGILQLKICTLTENLLKSNDQFSNLQSKYHKEINELKPNLDQKEAEVLMFKNEINLLQIKFKNQEDTINIMKREIDDINLEYFNEIEQIKIELTSSQSLMNHYKECYEKEAEQTKRLTQDILENNDYVCTLTSSLDDLEKQLSKLANEYEQYKIDKEKTLSILTNKLNASEEIVKKLFPVNSDTSDNYPIKKGTTITDVYTVYKETYLNLQTVTHELEESKINFNILQQQIMEEGPVIDKLENDLIESNEKIKVLCETTSRLELKLKDINNQLRVSNTKCDELAEKNEKLRSTEDDLSKQLCFLLRSNQSNKRFENRNNGIDMSPQSIISNNYLTFEDIQGLQKQNKKLLEVLRSLSKVNDEQEIQLITDMKEEIKLLEEKLESQTQIIVQQKEKISQMQSLDSMSKSLKELNDVEQNKIQSPTKISLENDKENSYKESEENVENLKHQLANSTTTINLLKEKLESNSIARLQLDQHVQGLNQQIDELLKKIKASNIKHSESSEKIVNLQNTISKLEHENYEIKTEVEKTKHEFNNLKKENDCMYLSNMNYSRELRQKTELQKEFEKMLASQLDSLIINWNLTLTCIAETDYDKVKFKDEYKKLTKTLKDVKENLLSKLEAIEDLSTYKELSRSRTSSLSLCPDERSNFQSGVSKLEHEVKSLKSKLSESEQLKNQIKSELNVSKQLYKSLEENLKKMSEYSSRLENEREIKKREYLDKDQQLINAMRELSNFNLSHKENIIKLQNQLVEYEKNYNKLLYNFEKEKRHNNELSNQINSQYMKIDKLEEELRKSFDSKKISETELNFKLSQYKNKLERLDALELFNKTKSAEIDHLKNQKAALEKSIEEIEDSHKKQLLKVDDDINSLKETIKRWQFENELLSEQFKSMANELINLGHLNNSKLSDKDDSFSNSSSTQFVDKQFTKMANLINILKDEKKAIILELNEKNADFNKLKSELHYKSKIIDDLQTQMKELRQLQSSSLLIGSDYSKIVEKIELCNGIEEKNKLLEEENLSLNSQLKNLQELDEKKTADIAVLKADLSGMQSLNEQKSAELSSAQRIAARWKERSNSVHSNTEYKQLLNTLEREKVKMTTALDQLKSMKSDKTCLEELLKKAETDRSEETNALKQEIIKMKTKLIGNNKSMETFKNIIRTYRQKFSDVASEIYKIKILARRYKHLSEELSNTLNTERSLWQSKIDEQQQGSCKIPIDVDERKKLIEQGKQEQKTESESQINELMAKIQEAEAGLNAAKSEVESTKAKSEDKELRAKQLLQQVRSKIQNLSKELDTTKKARDSLTIRVDELEKGGQIQEYQIQIARLDQENRKLILEKEHITIEKDRLSHDIQMLNHRVTALMRQFSNQQVKPSTSTGPDKLPVEPPTANIKPLGPAVNKPQPVHHSVTVNPWRSAAAETPLASIKPMTMQPRSVVVLPNSQTSSTSSQSSMSGTSSSTTITVHPQQPQSVDISSSGGNSLDSSEANSAAQSRHLTSSTLVQHVEVHHSVQFNGSESTATVSDSNETTAATPPSILPLQQVIGSAAAPSVTAVQISPAISIALVVPQGREQVQTTVSQPTTVSVSTVSPSQSQIDRYSVQNENGQAMESSISNIASSSAPGPSTESEPSVVTACTSGPSCSSLDTTTHSNTQRKRKADQLVTSYMKRSKSFMPREDNRREMEYEAPTSSQRDSEVSNSYTGPESNPQDNKEVEANTDMEVTSEATENNEVDLTSQECTADTNNMNETNDIQNEETELTTGESTPEHSSNAEATAMAVAEEDSPENSFQEFQNTPVSSASCEETKNTDSDQITSDVESRLTENDSISVEPQAGTSTDTTDTVGVSQSTENEETTRTLDLAQDTVEVLSSENEEDVEIKTPHDLEEIDNNDSSEPEIISVSSSPCKENEAVREESPVAGPSGVSSESSTNERKPIIWNESP